MQQTPGIRQGAHTGATEGILVPHRLVIGIADHKVALIVAGDDHAHGLAGAQQRVDRVDGVNALIGDDDIAAGLAGEGGSAGHGCDSLQFTGKSAFHGHGNRGKAPLLRIVGHSV